MTDLSVALSGAIILAAILTGASGLQCYECKIVADPGQNPNQTRLCIHFDYSQRFIVECPFSTMCRKKSFYLDIQNGGRITGVERDCAPQKHVYMEYKDEQWQEETEVLEAYTEGCHSLDDKGERTPPTEYCYCRSHLCNAGTTNTNVDSYHTDAMAVIVIFNLMKYIRSLR